MTVFDDLTVGGSDSTVAPGTHTVLTYAFPINGTFRVEQKVFGASGGGRASCLLLAVGDNDSRGGGMGDAMGGGESLPRTTDVKNTDFLTLLVVVVVLRSMFISMIFRYLQTNDESSRLYTSIGSFGQETPKHPLIQTQKDKLNFC